MHNAKKWQSGIKNLLWKIMKLAGGEIKEVGVCHDYCVFQKEKVAIDFILMLVV